MVQKSLPPQRRRRLLRVALVIVCVLVFLLLAIPPIAVFAITNGHVSYGVIENHPLQKRYRPADFGLTANDQLLETEDGLRVWTSEVTADNPKAVVIYLSGIRQPSVTYYYGHAKWMRENGYASILLEVRGHGQSDGGRVCLGYEEVRDCRAMVEYIQRQPRYAGVPIVIQGVSMGGAVAVNAFGQIPALDGLIAASAYASFEDVVEDTLRGMGIPGFLCALEKPLVRLSLRLFFGENANTNVPIKQVRNIGERPALFIASASDTQVPAENMTRLLSAAPAHCEGWLREGTSYGHFIVKDSNIENVTLDTEYCERLLAFLENQVLPRATR